jgi:predicted acetyltransferase
MNIAILEGTPGKWMINNSLKNNAFLLVKNIMDPNNVRGHFNAYFKNRGRNYVAINENGRMAGFAILRPNKNGTTNVLLIGTKPGRGTGRQIMNKIYNNARRRGSTKVRVIDPVNNARNFYRRLGYKNNNKNTMSRNVAKKRRR